MYYFALFFQVKQNELSKDMNDLFQTKKLLDRVKENLQLFQHKLARKTPKDEHEKSKLVVRVLQYLMQNFHVRKYYKAYTVKRSFIFRLIIIFIDS